MLRVNEQKKPHWPISKSDPEITPEVVPDLVEETEASPRDENETVQAAAPEPTVL